MCFARRRALLICAVIIFFTAPRTPQPWQLALLSLGVGEHYMRVPSHKLQRNLCDSSSSSSYNSKTDAKAELGSGARSAGPETSRKASSPQDRSLRSGNGIERAAKHILITTRPATLPGAAVLARRGAQQAPNPSPLENPDSIEPLGERLASTQTKS